MTVLIHCSPKGVLLPLDGKHHLIHVPCVPTTRATTPFVWITFLMTGRSTPHRIQASSIESEEVSETIEWEQIPRHPTVN